MPPSTGDQERIGYIPEIDTLRAVAVVLVVVFHAFPGVMPGGFIGVDVFFVISGFVISRTYLWPLIMGEKTLPQFYVARLRRLAPAALLVLLATSCAAAFILLPDRLIAFAWSLVAQPVYLANLVFWIEGDYFSGAMTKPLLHTWSLAVEEQFYVLWAPAIVLFRRFPKTVLAVVVTCALLSLWLGYLVAPRSPKTAFYLLPTRVWEFAVGVLAFLAAGRLANIGKGTANGVALGSIVIILLSALAFGERSPFPGVQALAACVASGVALLCFDRSGGRLPSIYRAAPFTYVGRISYGLYLWHWPPLVLYFLKTGKAADSGDAALLVLLALAGAIASYHLLEHPIRNRSWLPRPAGIVGLVVAGSVVTVAAGAAILRTGGLLFLYPPQVRPFLAAPEERGEFRCGKLAVMLAPRSELCDLTPDVSGKRGGVLIIGDSHADVLKESIAEIGRRNGVPVFLTVRNCDLGRYGSLSFCNARVFESVISQAKERGVTDVIAISYWELEKFSAAGLRADLSKLLDAGFRVQIMETVPGDKSYDPRARAMAALDGGPLRTDGIRREEHDRTVLPLRAAFSEAMAGLGGRVGILRPSDWLCDAQKCLYAPDGVPYYLDSNHLTFTGAKAIAPMFEMAVGEPP